MFGVLLIGPLSDSYGRKNAYLIAITVWVLISIIQYFVDNPYAWITTRFIAGGASMACNTAAVIYW